MVIRVSDKKKNYSKVTKLLVKPKDIAYTIIDLDSKVDITPIEKINGIIKVSTYKK